MKRTIYLNMHSREEAAKIFLSRFAETHTEEENINARDSWGRVTAHALYARLSSPLFHFAAMDGLAVTAEDTYTASDATPVSLRLDTEQAVLINTGHPLPEDKNAVIMIEHVLLSEDGKTARIRSAVFPWQHVRKVGEDIVATELLFPRGHRMRPADIAAIITAGIFTVPVRKKPILSLIPTGSELISVQEAAHTTIPHGKTIESNSAAIKALVQEAGGICHINPIVSDDPETIEDLLYWTVQGDSDIVVINAGSSAGSADYTVDILRKMGDVLIHGVTIMPGKPTILASINGKPVIGLPGYPVSAIIAMEYFVLPLLASMQGITLPHRETIQAILARDLPSPAGIEEFRRMIIGQIHEKAVAVPLKKGAGAITTLTRANGMLRIDSTSEGLPAGAPVKIELLVPHQEIERTLLCTGSHDLCLDLMNDALRNQSPACNLASTHVGSFGGIMAIKSGMCHMAGCHLLDPDDGSYNVNIIRKSLQGIPVRLLTLVHREQGFIVRPGNPKNIKSIHAIAQANALFINRQTGSGTRVLLDYELEKSGLNREAIHGYEEEEFTHMAVAVAVLTGKADVGIGIKSAAKALDLDFVPLTEERFDLIIPEPLFETPMIQNIREVITTETFKHSVEALGGYSTRATGQEVSL